MGDDVPPAPEEVPLPPEDIPTAPTEEPGQSATTSKAGKGKESTKPNILVMGAYPYNKWISDKYNKILLTSPEHKATLSTMELKKDFLKVEVFSGYNTNSLVELRAIRIGREFKVKYVVALAEEDMLRAGRIRDELGIEGQSYESALQFRDKLLMKAHLKEKKITVPECARVESALDVIQFIEKNGYPVVCKPVRGFGSVGVHILKNEAELSRWLENGLGGAVKGTDGPIDLEVESFIDGTMYHIDGIVYKNELKLVWPSRYLATVQNFEKNPFIAAVSVEEKNPLLLPIQNFVRESLEAIKGAPSMYPFHAEIWVTKDGKLVFCEVGGRTGGGGIPEQILELFGVLLNKSSSQVQCDDEVTGPIIENWKTRRPAEERKVVGWMFLYPTVGKTIISLPKTCPLPGVVSMELFHNVGKKFESRGHCADALANFIVYGDTEKQVEERLLACCDWMHKQNIYD